MKMKIESGAYCDYGFHGKRHISYVFKISNKKLTTQIKTPHTHTLTHKNGQTKKKTQFRWQKVCSASHHHTDIPQRSENS